MKFLITNSVPLNGGDEALLRALILSLKHRWPDSDVMVLCKDLELCRKQLPDLRFASDLEFAKSEESRQETMECYRAADVVLSAPGGFLHDYYAIEDRLKGFELALKLSKPLILFAQSIGPFWKNSSVKRVREVLNRVSSICVRDEISRKRLLECGVDSSRIRVTADAAFFWRRFAPDLFKDKHDTRVGLVGMCFRVWPLGDQAMRDKTLAKAEQLCRHILSNRGRRILFLSTCQGIPGYIDDSELALQIVDRLPAELKQLCEVDRSRYAPRDLIQALNKCDVFIGMRLHACLLAMLGGVPTMGLGYEDKTEQIFRQMGIESYQIHYENSGEIWIQGAEHLLTNLTTVRDQLPRALDEGCKAAQAAMIAVEEQVQRMAQPDLPPAEQRWSQSVVRYGTPHLRLRQVAALVNETNPKRMLDIGCATGYLRLLCPKVEYVGCDFIAPAAPPEFSFYQCNFNRDPLPATLNRFDVIVCSGILEYIEEMSRFLNSLRSSLTPGGRLIVSYFNMNHASRISKMIRGQSLPVHPDWRGFYSPRHLENLIEESGFELVDRFVTEHGFGEATSIEETVAAPLTLPKAHWWSTLLAHQFLFVATPRALARHSGNGA